jgi:hypothetical protein
VPRGQRDLSLRPYFVGGKSDCASRELVNMRSVGDIPKEHVVSIFRAKVSVKPRPLSPTGPVP